MSSAANKIKTLVRAVWHMLVFTCRTWKFFWAKSPHTGMRYCQDFGYIDCVFMTRTQIASAQLLEHIQQRKMSDAAMRKLEADVAKGNIVPMRKRGKSLLN